jgi:hypothetical protein
MNLIEALYWAYQQDLNLGLTEAGGMVWVSRRSKIIHGESLGTGSDQAALEKTIVRALSHVRREMEAKE